MSVNSLVLLPGMGADARMFLPQRHTFPGLRIAEWIVPESRETVAHYAARMVERYCPTAPLVIGGASFGGVVAQEMAALASVKTCLLIGSLRSGAGLRPLYHHGRSVARFAFAVPQGARLALWMSSPLARFSQRGVLRQLAEADGRFLKWALRALLEWSPTPAVSQLTIHQIHGEKDWLLPARLSHAEVIVPGAGHLLSLTHPREVNEFIRAHCSLG